MKGTLGLGGSIKAELLLKEDRFSSTLEHDPNSSTHNHVDESAGPLCWHVQIEISRKKLQVTGQQKREMNQAMMA